MFKSCPGAGLYKQPIPEEIVCPGCSAQLEIWSDEAQVKCSACGRFIMREYSQASCLEWCAYARECLGYAAYEKYARNKLLTQKERLISEMKKVFLKDEKRLNHALRVLDYAEEITRFEKGDWHIVVPAAILHDIGIKESERKYGSSAGNYQEKEGPAIAREILLRAGFDKKSIDEIADIIAHHHSPGKVDTLNFKIVYDSDSLVNLKDEVDLCDKDKLRDWIDRIFLTAKGKSMARKVYLGEGIDNDVP